jgi:glycosyltransferase involved in cell wall biosynthesis
MKKILFYALEDQGFVSHRLSFALELKKNCYDIYLVTKISHYKSYLEKKGIKVIETPHDTRHSLNIFNIISRIFFIKNTIKKINPSIINNIGINPVIIGTVAAKFFKNIKIINAITGLGSLVTIKDIKIFFLRSFIKIFFKIFLSSTALIVQNRFDKKFFLDLKIKKIKIYLVLGMGIDLLHPLKKKPLLNKKIRIILHSRMLRVKGIYEYYNAAVYLKKYKNICEFFLVGSPDYNNSQFIGEKILKKMNDKGYFTYLVHENNFRDFLIKFDIACLPSYREGLPRSLIEAANASLPIVATNVPGNSEIVTNGINGILVESKNYIALAKALEKLILDKKLRIKMGKESLKLIKNKFTKKIIFKRMINIYKHL